MEELRGAPVARAIMDKTAGEITRLAQAGIMPKLAVFRVGSREDDIAYERSIIKRFSAAGAAVEVMALSEDATQEELEAAVRRAADDESVHGILVFSPLPKKFNAGRIRMLIPAEKDVDGMTDASLAGVFRGDKNAFAPCTAQAVVEILRYYGMENLAGKRVTVVGRSTVVGKPLAMLLLGMNATVTVCHTKTADTAAECRRADVVIACAGQARMVTDEYMSAGQTIIDVGINADGDGICGDVDYAAAQSIVAAATPVPGGVGAVTTAVLLSHTVRNAAIA
ncbi:MAG TPA: bifunctional 5,10-methylene-tetrahydrofolate dehydrogenase/5,10-methylene-tetrahydrofolate cyclohydrolase [Clostridiales bacterium]|jgi:methylenetetrahydrofolate dehydrogenase (NADP+)/methenyltetrahydrofolate cyclohydrolase|nr:bifunctional 5,10-methylene-tetrahydrofolate dehydrogenase/5,10-methylene-tetrahydrofolate cyclohydrolase [Candidatus Apopatosoma intestinale]